ncbi:hypothetical protein HKD37_14G041208 [Glycine soja]
MTKAIESHHLPGDILNDIPAKYVDRAVICELLLLNTFQILLLFNIDFAYCYKIELYIDPVVHDYRRCSSRKGGSVSAESSPTVSKLCLKMSLENIVKDIPRLLTSLRHMEVESKILKALQPKLQLDPTPKLDRLCESLLPTKE